ncbi:MAG: GGDEF domain-containing protein [Lachnospiraceae bacterium]|nr:GGDEF domain-containing protein [Lachnospiraceae bacterium]
MNYDGFISHLKTVASVLSVSLNPDGTCGKILLEAANDAYLQTIHTRREDFVPGRPYDLYVPADRNYEAMSYRCVKESRMIHAYVDAGQYNAWMEIYMLPLVSDEPNKGYYLFSYDMSEKFDAERLADVPPETAMQMLSISVRLRDNSDFQEAMNAIIRDIRLYCEANQCCIILTDFRKRSSSMLCESVAETEQIMDREILEADFFFPIIEIWDRMTSESNCYIIHDAKELEQLKEKDQMWYESLKASGVYSLVLYPLKAGGETIGFIMATNFNSERTLAIKTNLEVATFLLAAEIANRQLFTRMKILSDTDLLTGLYNRNAMNNRVSDIVSGTAPLTADYGVVFADLNGLKNVNDEEGHVAGDQLLKDAADVLRATYTSECSIFRVGGDEFMVLVEGHTEEEFVQLTLKLRENCEATRHVRMAIGTFFSPASEDIRVALHNADEAMYRDKRDYYDRHPELKRRI